MKRFAICPLLIICAALLLAAGPVVDRVAAKAASQTAGKAAGQVSPPVTPQLKRHQATGSVASSGANQLVLLKTFGRNQARWNFVLNAKTKLDGKVTKGTRVRIYYHDDKGQRVAEQIKVLTPTVPAASKPLTTPQASPPSHQ